MPECRTQSAQAIQDRETELAALRAALAAAKIAAAKSEAELQELRTLVPRLRQENAESHRTLMHVQQERDAQEVEGRRARVEQETAAYTKQSQELEQVRLAVSAMAQELERIKLRAAAIPVRHLSDGADNGPGSHASQQKKRAETRPLTAPREERPETTFMKQISMPIETHGEGPQAPRSVVIESGETLWRLAQRYGVTVQQLREANRLPTDRVKVGARLIIPGTPQR